ncbi:MAG: family 43 glycosylhydrolase [Oscillospiraceae bacterium]|nr:family 43 glycosylhydrolase [Oscillospiraceae bacterium]
MKKLTDIHIRDPFILVDSGKYYLYGTRGEGCWDTCSGFDVYVSTDLINWSDPVSVFEKNEDFWADRQYWAPEVHRYHGRYYMFASFCGEGRHRGTQILVADTPDGCFTPLTKTPITPADWDCLDGTLYISKDGTPYIVFCHEWVQIGDGEIAAMRLTDDLCLPAAEPVILFHGSEPVWASGDGCGNYITDGPFLLRYSDRELYMIWSSYCDSRYVLACAVSDSGEIDGKWRQCEDVLFSEDAGHGMLFYDKNNVLKLVVHAPNNSPCERPKLIDVQISNGCLTAAEQKL